MMNNNKSFILTKDKKTVEILFNSGFLLLNENNGIYIFANSNLNTFSENIDISKVTFTNKMFV